jgi:hypothetical protein
MIIPSQMRASVTGSQDGRLEVGTPHDEPNYISLFQDDDLILVYRDQVDVLIEELQKFKEKA